MNIEAAAAVFGFMMKALATRVLAFVALFMTFGLFCWSMWLGTWIAFAIAGGFGAAIFLPILSRTLQPGSENAEASK